MTGPASSRPRRFIEGTAAVAIWMALGLAFHIGANAYLVLGIAITIPFQLYVRRAPLRAMWVRDAPPFRLGLLCIVIAILLMLVPLSKLVGLAVARTKDWAALCWLVAALVGACAAAYALRYFTRETLRDQLLCLATAGVIAIAIMAVIAITSGPTHHQSLLVRVSALWGFWHYPLTDNPLSFHDFPKTIGDLPLVHVLIGMFLSIYWRRSGNLFVTGSVHALIDAVRNALAV